MLLCHYPRIMRIVTRVVTLDCQPSGTERVLAGMLMEIALQDGYGKRGAFGIYVRYETRLSHTCPRR